MSAIKGVHHICLKPNKDIYQKTVAFYTDVLGCATVRAWGEGDGAGCMLSCGDNTVMEILHGDGDGRVNTGAFEHIAFDVDDVDALLETVRASGRRITMESQTIRITPDYPVRIAFFEGPAGETVELFCELRV